jgi:XXXCH domain-containing protein
MSMSEWKIKRLIPQSQVPAFLRSIADALEGRPNDRWPRLKDLPLPITKLEIKGKVEVDTWKLKVSVRTIVQATKSAEVAMDEPPSATEPPKSDYKHLKKQLNTAYTAIRESIATRQKPQPEVMRAFMTKAQDMLTFTGTSYGEPHYALFRKACLKLVEAYEAENWEALRSSFALIAQLKKDCHKTYK